MLQSKLSNEVEMQISKRPRLTMDPTLQDAVPYEDKEVAGQGEEDEDEEEEEDEEEDKDKDDDEKEGASEHDERRGRQPIWTSTQ